MLRAKERARGDSHGCIACTRHDTEPMQIVNTLDHCQQRTPNPRQALPRGATQRRLNANPPSPRCQAPRASPPPPKAWR